jgi:hypothetical protein
MKHVIDYQLLPKLDYRPGFSRFYSAERMLMEQRCCLRWFPEYWRGADGVHQGSGTGFWKVTAAT